jgi:hypothetical protein
MDSIRKKQVDSLHIYHKKRLAFECDTTTYNNSLNFGKAAALSILAYADTDGGAKAYLNNKPHDYNPPIGPEKWRRTFPDYLDALTPFWPSIRPIMAIGLIQVRPFIRPLWKFIKRQRTVVLRKNGLPIFGVTIFSFLHLMLRADGFQFRIRL